MTGHWTVLATTLSLGGMASVGLNHYMNVEQFVHEKRNAVPQKENTLVIQEKLQNVESKLNEYISNERSELFTLMSQQAQALEQVKLSQESQEARIKRLSVEQTEMIFKLDTHDESFRPLRVRGDELRRIGDDSISELETSNNLLLPPVDGW